MKSHDLRIRIGIRKNLPCLSVYLFCSRGNFAVTHIGFEGSEIAVYERHALVIDRHLANFAGNPG